MVGNQGILERGQEGLELSVLTQVTESEERRRMGEGLERRGSEMERWNINWCTEGWWPDPRTPWREMSGTLILVDQGRNGEGINSLRRVERLEGEIVHSRQGETWGDQLTLLGTRTRAGHL